MGERTNLKYLSLDKNNLVDLPINMKRMQVCMTVYVSSYLLYICSHTTIYTFSYHDKDADPLVAALLTLY